MPRPATESDVPAGTLGHITEIEPQPASLPIHVNWEDVEGFSVVDAYEIELVGTIGEQAAPLESNHGLTFAQETVMTIRRDGELIAIELQPNGHIERHITERATRAKSLSVFGADKPQTI